jgi:hypothetical protein
MPKVKTEAKPEVTPVSAVAVTPDVSAEVVAAKPPAAKKASGKKKSAAKVPAQEVPTKVASIPKASTVKAPAKKVVKAKPPAPAAAPAVSAEPAKAKQKLVRDSFTMPNVDFDLIQSLKDRALNFKRPAKKSELLRAGLQALSALTDAKLKSALDSLAPLKAGRPKKGD